MNKLIEDKRYDDVVKLFDYGIQRGFSTSNGRAYPTDVIMLTIEALYRQVNHRQTIERIQYSIRMVRFVVHFTIEYQRIID
jgi:hypothetical protein